ncbi:MAG: aldehyde ferredoxin oxidoreductase family protein [Planctomycetota bacterium]
MTHPIVYGYHGKILDIDLTTGRIEVKPLDTAVIEMYLGGRGMATRLFHDEIDPSCDPLGKDNVVVLATSPLLRTPSPTACRGHMVFKSPLTQVIGSANCGGSWAHVFKGTGYDVLILRGRAAEPVMIDITPQSVQIKPATRLWGLDVHQTTDQLISECEPAAKPKVLCIGPAGERLVRIAAVMNDKNRAYGRTGPGAVFGSKNLKAVRVSGKEEIRIKDMERYQSGLDQARYLLKQAPVTKRLLRELGTVGLFKLINVIDMLPHRNFQDNIHDEALLDNISGEALRDHLLVKSGACFRCPMACQRHTKVGKRFGEGPEYETTVMMGPACDIYDREAITLAGYVCNELGIDTISFGGTVACAMELYEKGYLTKEDTHGLELGFGNHGVLEELARITALREGVGDRLAEGSLRLAKSCGHPELSMTVKGLEMPAYDPRASYTQALGYMTSPTGACHLRGGYAVSLAFFGGTKEIPRFSLLQSPIAIRNMQNHGIIQDSLGICRFTGFAFSAEPWSRMVSGTTGLDFSTARLEETADRIAALERLFNCEAGVTSEHDTLPERFSSEKILVGGEERCITREVIEKLKSDYYELQGWDEQGRPTETRLKSLEITRG